MDKNKEALSLEPHEMFSGVSVFIVKSLLPSCREDRL